MVLRTGTKKRIPPIMHVLMVFLAALLIPVPSHALMSSPNASAPVATVHRDLLDLAVDSPDEIVPVIVQKTAQGENVEQWVVARGGAIIQELQIINAFAAELPAALLSQLGQVEGVRWVSPDGEVENMASSKNSYYLHSANPGGDSAPQAVLLLDRNVPTSPILRNSDANRNGGPGLTLQPGGDLNSTDGKIQRWQMAPFETDVTLRGSASLRLYVAAEGFQPLATGKFWAYLIHHRAGGQSNVIASASLEQSWRADWRRVNLKFPSLIYVIPAHDSLELAITVDAATRSPMMFAFDSADYPAHLKIVIHDALVTGTSFYLANGVGDSAGDTTSHAALPVGYVPPTAGPLGNYDTDRDNVPGLLIRRGGALNSAPGVGDVQRWRLGPFTADTQLAPEAELEFFAVVRGFQKNKSAKIWGYLNEITPDGQVVRVIASASLARSDWGDKFSNFKLAFNYPTTTLAAGNQLEVALSVDALSTDDMWLAYGTKDYPSRLKTQFLPVLPYSLPETIQATAAWAKGYDGTGVRVAIIDSGIWKDSPDFVDQSPTGTVSRLLHYMGIGSDGTDKYGHGTFIAGVVAGNGNTSFGFYKGIAPRAGILSVRVSDEWGGAKESDVVAGMQWVLQNKAQYNIRVVNMSLNSMVAQPYGMSPLDAAAEILWFNGIVIVVSSGNNGARTPGVVYAPANDPFVIAVGSTDELETPDPADDILSTFSAYGVTPEGVIRPDVVVPGSYIVSLLADHSNFNNVYKANQMPVMDRSGASDYRYFVASGTSISAGAVTGAAALLLQAVPNLNPDQVKYLLKVSAMPLADMTGAGAGEVNIAKAIELAQSYANVVEIPGANDGMVISPLLYSGSDPVQWNSVNWNSVNWNSVNWNSVNWNSVNWNSVNWNSVDIGVGPAGEAISGMQAPLLLDEDAEIYDYPVEQPEEQPAKQQLLLPSLGR